MLLAPATAASVGVTRPSRDIVAEMPVFFQGFAGTFHQIHLVRSLPP